jgi:ATP-dependent Lon protease
MPLFGVASIEQEPEETIIFWSVREAKFDQKSELSRHLVGYVPRKGMGRVSSAIQEFDRQSMTAKTRSGRIYHLSGSPGFSNDAEYVWLQWQSFNGVKEEIDVTDQYGF